MSDFKLLSPAAAGTILDNLFKKTSDRKFAISVNEDKCFGEKRLDLGQISLPVEDTEFSVVDNSDRSGCYEWHVPTPEALRSGLMQSLDVPPAEGNNKARAEKELAKIERVLDLVAATAARLGLTLPNFDADSLAEFPFRRPVTVVTDTAAIAQGALDFVARYLHPAARIKIPAIAHMEIVNLGDRYFAQRRSPKSKAAMLYEHIISQGSQRTLLRLELQSDVEIERTAVMSEPLRSAFQKESGETADLNLSAPVRSFCDRLILEVARQHQSYSAPGHAVYLLTADQGLARMAMSEGIEPIFYASPVANDFLGKIVTGSGFNPLTGALSVVPLTQVLWELAVAFGNARIALPDDSAYVEVATIGDGLTWSPFHSREDLFWVRTEGEIEAGDGIATPPSSQTGTQTKKLESTMVEIKPVAEAIVPKRADETTSMIRFSAERLLDLVAILGARKPVAQKALLSQADISEKAWADYRRLLESGEFILADKKSNWIGTERLDSLWNACVATDFEAMTNVLKLIPSCNFFFQTLEEQKKFSEGKSPFPSRVLSGYQGLAEFCCIGAPIAGEGFYATATNPKPTAFTEIALKQFVRIAKGEKLASVGAWLEELIRSEGIHPLNARSRLAEARAAKLIHLITEGSTTDTRHDRKMIRTLVVERDKPLVRTEYLYRGDFLIPGKSSTSFRLEEMAK
ncbi:hypothetical protein PQR53_15245 [Paraburkholderia fungorum]|uniref:hypothetical protein n=1 Tax=Paraburkholderia fungorum TaxID=134537 RepID=UPI0038BA718C